jgi:hypothetical protein
MAHHLIGRFEVSSRKIWLLGDGHFASICLCYFSMEAEEAGLPNCYLNILKSGVVKLSYQHLKSSVGGLIKVTFPFFSIPFARRVAVALFPRNVKRET